MAEIRPSDIFYGHLGLTTYDQQQHKWLFARSLAPSKKWSLVRQAYQTIPPLPFENSAKDNISGLTLRKQLQLLSRSYPETVPALNILPAFSRVSQAVISSLNQSDVDACSLVTSAQLEDSTVSMAERNRTFIFAGVADKVGKVLRIHLLQHRIFGWGNESAHQQIGVFHLHESEETSWTSSHGQIREVITSERFGGKGFLLAVRQTDATTIFKPLRKPAALESTVLNANPLFTIESAGVEHQCIAFNPWNENQFAIVDKLGRLMIFDILSCTNSEQDNIKPVLQGNITQDESEDEVHGLNSDSWRSISWIVNGDLMIHCTRNSVGIWKIDFDAEKLTKCILKKNFPVVDTILQTSRSPANEDDIFVLTTSSIHIFKIWEQSSDEAEDIGEGGVCLLVERILTWRHFRPNDDIGLRMRFTKTCDSTLIVLTSRLSNIRVGYLFSATMHEGQALARVSDPFYIDSFEPSTRRAETRHCPLDFELVRLDYLQVVSEQLENRTTTNDVGEFYRSHGVIFYQSISLREDFTLETSFYASQTEDELNRSHYMLKDGIRLPTFEVTSISRFKPANGPLVRGAADDLDIKSATFAVNHLDLRANFSSSHSRPQVDRQSEIDISLLRSTIFDQEELSLPNILGLAPEDQTEQMTVGETLEALIRWKVENNISSMETILELSAVYRTLSTLDEILEMCDSFHLNTQKFSAKENSQRAIKILNLVQTTVLSTQFPMDAEKFVSPVNLYAQLLQKEIDSFPRLPASMKHRVENLVRIVTQDVFLSSIGCALLSSHKASHADSRLESSDAVENDDDGRVATENISADSRESITENEAVARLQSYATLEPQVPLAAKMTKILNHWTVGTDPRAYSWEKRFRNQSTEETVAETLQPKATRKHRQPLRNPRARGELHDTASHPTPFVTRDWDSSPLRAPPVLSSSQVKEEPQIASQVERGMFATRNQVKGRRRDKRPGF